MTGKVRGSHISGAYLFLNSNLGLWGMKYCFWLTGVAPGFSLTTTGGVFWARLGGLSLAHTPGILKGISGISESLPLGV
jgi:hypothetical protein